MSLKSRVHGAFDRIMPEKQPEVHPHIDNATDRIESRNNFLKIAGIGAAVLGLFGAGAVSGIEVSDISEASRMTLQVIAATGSAALLGGLGMALHEHQVAEQLQAVEVTA